MTPMKRGAAKGKLAVEAMRNGEKDKALRLFQEATDIFRDADFRLKEITMLRPILILLEGKARIPALQQAETAYRDMGLESDAYKLSCEAAELEMA